MAFEEGRFLRAADGEYERVIVSLGLRWDDSHLEVPANEEGAPTIASNRIRYGLQRAHGSLGLVYRATERFSVAANVGRGWRLPNAFELFAFGDHVGVGAFQLGNPDLEEETAISTELSARYQSGHWRAVLTGFRSDYSDFIYLVELAEDEVPDFVPSNEDVFFYRQTDAVIDGLVGQTVGRFIAVWRKDGAVLPDAVEGGEDHAAAAAPALACVVLENEHVRVTEDRGHARRRPVAGARRRGSSD